MVIDQSKYDRQKLASERWRNSKGIGCLNLTPRFGKTYLAIHFIINPHLQKSSENSVIITVPTEAIAKHWKDNLLIHGEDLKDRVKILTANYLDNKADHSFNCSLFIIDEPQKFMTDIRKLIIDGTIVDSKYRLALSGTPPTEQWFRELYPIIDTVTEQEAVENNWIAKFIEYNYLLDLSEEDKIRYKEFSIPITETLELFKDKWKLFGIGRGASLFDNDFDVIRACQSGKNTPNPRGDGFIFIPYDKVCNALASLMGWGQDIDITTDYGRDRNIYWSPISIHERAKIFIDFIRKRNEILINNPIKLEAVKSIIKTFPLTTICFNESIEFVEKVNDMINDCDSFNDYRSIAYHSKIESRPLIDLETGQYFTYKSGDRKGEPKLFGQTAIKNMTIEGVRNGTFQFLSTAKSLDEGLDIPNIEQVICTAGTTNPMTYQQRTARGKTVDIYNPNKVTKIFNLVFNDFTDEENRVINSRDKQKLIKRQRNSSNNIQWIQSIDEIFDTNNYE